MSKTNKRNCKSCGNPQRKNGFTKSRKQRWQCLTCNRSRVALAEKKSENKTLKEFIFWLTNQSSKQTIFKGSRMKLRRKFRWCWSVNPAIDLPTGNAKCIIIDAIYLGRKACCMIARTMENVIAYEWSERENLEDYLRLFSKIPEPKFIITDGHRACLHAIKRTYTDTKVQRCVFHINMFTRIHLTGKPKIPQSVALLHQVRKLFAITDWSAAHTWIKEFKEWEKHSHKFLNEKTYYIDSVTKKERWQYTHRRLRAARKHIENVITDDSLFTYLDAEIPNNTDLVEGGINSRLKELRRCHKGLNLERQKRLIEWYLWSRSTSKNHKIS